MSRDLNDPSPSFNNVIWSITILLLPLKWLLIHKQNIGLVNHIEPGQRLLRGAEHFSGGRQNGWMPAATPFRGARCWPCAQPTLSPAAVSAGRSARLSGSALSPGDARSPGAGHIVAAGTRWSRTQTAPGCLTWPLLKPVIWGFPSN